MYTEAVRRAAEREPRQFQETGRLAFEGVLGKVYNPRDSLKRLQWERTLVFDGGGEQGEMTVRCRDPSDDSRLVVRLVPCNHADDVAFLQKEACEIRDTLHPNLLRVRDVHLHEIERFTHTGTRAERWKLVVISCTFCPGGRLVDELDRMRSEAMALGKGSMHVRLPVAPEAFRFDEGDPESVTDTRTAMHQRIAALAEELEKWLAQVASGLRALHASGCTHRNLNPGNIYLDERRRAVVGGFQCIKTARAPGCPTSLGRADCGSACVIAPEVEDGGVAGTSADIWAFGCCLYRWITGELPRMRTLPIARALQRVPHAYSEKIRRVLRMALEPRPQSRATADDIWAVLGGK